ncbi:MAG: radical SAM protein [Bdellovibrionales bacterium]|nr:radical SAM protein [Bdellovibrionales bacterium]
MAATKHFEPLGDIRTLKLSITGECNLNCFYCKALEHDKEFFELKKSLSASDVNKFVKIVGEFGINRVLIEGAEPLLRKDAPSFVKAAHANKKIQDVRLITNGTYLKAYADPLRKMGLKKVDVNFDTLHFMKYQRITGHDSLYRVLDGIDKVEKLKYSDIVLNILLLKGINEDEIVEIARMTRERKVHIRFIEYDAQNENEDPYENKKTMTVLDAKKMIDNYQILERVVEFDQEPSNLAFRFPQAVGSISFVSRVELEKKRAQPYIQLNANGEVFNSRDPKKTLSILDAIRKDAKDPKFRKSIEKIYLAKAPTEKTSTSKTKSKKTSDTVSKIKTKSRRKSSARKTTSRKQTSSITA